MRIRNRGGASCTPYPQPQPQPHHHHHNHHHHHHHRHGRSPLAVPPEGSQADPGRAVDISAIGWRKALLGTERRRFDSRDEVEQGGECSKWNGSTRMQGQIIGIASKQAIKNEEFIPKEAASSTSSEQGNDDDTDSDRVVNPRRLAENSLRCEHSMVQYHVKGKCSAMFAMPSKKRRRTKQAPLCSHDNKLPGEKTIPKDEGHPPVKVAGKDVKSQETNGNGDKCSIMHAGSRCRRMNGRGWRCSQRTLVGYALCEHHLGKGRLKSINSNASPLDNGVKVTQVKDSQFGLSHPAEDNCERHHAKKRIVKARSLKLISL